MTIHCRSCNDKGVGIYTDEKGYLYSGLCPECKGLEPVVICTAAPEGCRIANKLCLNPCGMSWRIEWSAPARDAGRKITAKPPTQAKAGRK